MIEGMRNPTDFLDLSSDELLHELAVVVGMISETTQQLAFVEQQEMRVKAEAYMESTDTRVTGRNKVASLHALENTCSVIELKADLAVLIEYKFFIIRLLDRQE